MKNRDTYKTVLDLANYDEDGFNEISTNTIAVFIDLAKAFDIIDRTNEKLFDCAPMWKITLI